MISVIPSTEVNKIKIHFLCHILGKKNSCQVGQEKEFNIKTGCKSKRGPLRQLRDEQLQESFPPWGQRDPEEVIALTLSSFLYSLLQDSGLGLGV